MCQAIREMREESRLEGEKLGKFKGKIELLREMGYEDDEIAKRLDLALSQIDDLMAFEA